jgi:hypothetical protein
MIVNLLLLLLLLLLLKFLSVLLLVRNPSPFSIVV